MPLDLLEVSTQVRQMGELLAERRADHARRLSLLDAMLAEYTDRWQELAELAERVRERVAVPTGPLDERHLPPEPLQAYTALATDGAEIDPDRLVLLDRRRTNNSRTLASQGAGAATRWAGRWMIWMQDLVLTYASLV